MKQEKASAPFLKKNGKKLLLIWFPALQTPAPAGAKVFWFLRPDDKAAKPRSLNRDASQGSKKNFFLTYGVTP
jgi:hypothetical protein